MSTGEEHYFDWFGERGQGALVVGALLAVFGGYPFDDEDRSVLMALGLEGQDSA